MPCLISEQRKCDSFFCLRRKPKLIGGSNCDLHLREFARQHVHESRVLRASTGGDELAESNLFGSLRERHHEVGNRFGDRTRRQRRRGRDNVMSFLASAEAKEPGDKLTAKLLAASGFRRTADERSARAEAASQPSPRICLCRRAYLRDRKADRTAPARLRR